MKAAKSKTYKLQNPEVIQPKNPDDPLYKLVEEYIIVGDCKQIAAKLNINNDSVVSDVKHGKRKSRYVWDCLITLALKRMKEREKILDYHNKVSSKQAA